MGPDIPGSIGTFLGVLIRVGDGYLGVSLPSFPVQYPVGRVVVAAVVLVAVGI